MSVGYLFNSFKFKINLTSPSGLGTVNVGDKNSFFSTVDDIIMRFANKVVISVYETGLSGLRIFVLYKECLAGRLDPEVKSKCVKVRLYVQFNSI